MKNEARRVFLKASVSGAALGVMMSSGLLIPRISLGKSLTNAFESKELEVILKELYDTSSTEPSDSVSIIAPGIAENGTVVPVTVRSTLSNIKSISIIAEKNPRPLVAIYEMTNGMEGHLGTRIKLGKTQDVWAVVQSDGKLFTAKTQVKVTIGGCGG